MAIKKADRPRRVVGVMVHHRDGLYRNTIPATACGFDAPSVTTSTSWDMVDCPDCIRIAKPLPATVKRVDLFGHVEDTYATEGELNGWRAQQAHLVGKQGRMI